MTKICIEGVASVLNGDVPTGPEKYTHRVGRTVRMGRTSMAVSFVPECDKEGSEGRAANRYLTGFSRRIGSRLIFLPRQSADRHVPSRVADAPRVADARTVELVHDSAGCSASGSRSKIYIV